MSLISVVFSAVVAALIAIKVREVNAACSVVLSAAACVMLMYFVVDRFNRIAGYVDRITGYVSVNIVYVDIILKMIGIAYICQFATDICRDAGYGAIASQIEICGKVSLMLLGMPVLMSVIDLVVSIVGE